MDGNVSDWCINFLIPFNFAMPGNHILSGEERY